MRPDFVFRHANRARAIDQFSEFLRLAVVHDSDVAFSPEYSCPWKVLENAIVLQTLPKAGKLWILGCEAISRDDLQNVIAAHSNIEWIYEPIPTGAGRFLDVLAYVTKADATAGGPIRM